MPAAFPRIRRRKEAGYTLLLVVFLVASMILVAGAAAPNILTTGRREKETEMVWRGEQYERAIGMYYRKFGKYPTKVEDLTRQTNGVRFLRKAYTDPMNTDDGSWRFIYVGPNGQLIGSLGQTSLLQSALASPGLGNALTMGGGLQPLAPPAAPGAANGAAQTPALTQPGQQPSTAPAPNPLESQPQMLSGDVLGGNIIGVGSKINRASIRTYLGGDKYQKWEFIWNPSGQIAAPTQAPLNPNANPTGAPTAPNGTSPDAQQPQQNPQMPSITTPQQ